MELRDFVSTKDVDHAIATMLTCFIQTQKHQIAEQLRSKFSKYLSHAGDQTSLCKYLLEKEFRRAFQLRAMMEAQADVEVSFGAFKKIAEAYDLVDAVEKFVESADF